MGVFIGQRHDSKHMTNAAVEQLVQAMESSDRLEAALAVRTITRIDSGASDEAVELRSRRIGDYYRHYATLTNSDRRTKDWLAQIEQLARTNKVVAQEIFAQHKGG